MLDIIPLPALGKHLNYIWLIKNTHSRQIVIVDPGDAEPVFRKIKQEHLLPVAILITHHHWDHTNGIEALVARYDIPVYTPYHEAVAASTDLLDDGDTLFLSELALSLTILAVPGHTKGAIAYYAAAQKSLPHGLVLSGDTLFAAGCGRVFEGTCAEMYRSLLKFKSLPEQTLLYCGHEYTLANLAFAAAVEPNNTAVLAQRERAQKLQAAQQPTLPTSIGLEKATNPFLRCEQAAIKAAAERHVGQPLPTAAAVFTALRTWKDNF